MVRKLEPLKDLPIPIVEDILYRPLSDLLNDEVDIPVKDIRTWVHRSSADRMEEAKKKEKITRPMNAFLLYRFAYYGLFKEYLRQKDHRSDGQAISKAIGLKWRSEERAVRCNFEELASIERHHHSTLQSRFNQSTFKRLQSRIKRVSSSPTSPDTEMRGESVNSQNDKRPSPEAASLVIEQPERQFGHPVGLQWPAIPDWGIMDSSPVPPEIFSSPCHLDNTPYQYGDLASASFHNNSSDEHWSELHSQPICVGYINPQLLLQ
ncbi:HMG-box [Penicillium samsonianum]|uniref:HMG-box n=1 Tax=Penicillium samsonianum TaxID=1882272 RepID=UPI0025475EE4|nr:HMG-box [Penicillium samsonianum]KAJ6125838.1 HMG-box [Penicillium samsonianum]